MTTYTTYTTIAVDARQYEDADDSLTAAAEEYASDHGLESWQVTAVWAGDRDQIELRVPTTIKMTAAETETYDDGDGPAQDALMRDLRARARELHEETGKPVEIYTADGIVADVIQ